MAIFDSNKKMYLTFYVSLTDPARVAELKALYPTGLNRAPYNPGPPAGGAAVEFSAPFVGYKQPKASEAPFTWTPWSGEGEQDGPFPLNVATFQRHTGGFLGIGGTTVRYYWMAEFVVAADPEGDPGTPGEDQADIPVRRFIEGFETPGIASIAATGRFSRDASRHAGGFGFAIRGLTAFESALTTTYFPAVVAANNWERFYIRLRQLPSATVTFWKWNGFPSAGVGNVLAITASGQIAIYESSAGGVLSLIDTIPDYTLNVWDGTVDDRAWHRVDLLYRVHSPTDGTSFMRIYIDGDLKTTVGTPAASRVVSTQIGPVNGDANSLYLDIDDWFNADIPTRDGEENLTGKDFVNGTKIVLVKPTEFGSGHGSWAGDVRILMQNPQGSAPNGIVAELLTSSAADAVAEVETDAEAVCDTDPGSIGVASFLVIGTGARGTTSGKMGYQIGVEAAVDTAVVQAVTVQPMGIIYSPGTAVAEGETPELPVVTPLKLRHTKGDAADAASLACLLAQVEMVGKWGPEDYNQADIEDIEKPTPVPVGQHNAPYPRSPWASTALAAPIAPYIVWGGTYVGNGTGQDINFRAPIHWFLIRPVTGGAGGYFWYSTMRASHKAWTFGVKAQIVSCEEDPAYAATPGEDSQTQQYRVRVAGSDTQINANTVVYEYIAISDPGMRFMHNLTLTNKVDQGPTEQVLIDPTYEAEFAFMFAELAGASATVGFFAKGPGEAADAMINYSPTTVLTPALTFGLGVITTDLKLHELPAGSAGATALSLWRRHDGNNDTGESGVVTFGSYVGDGAASRTINFGTGGNRRPLFAFVFAGAGGGYGFSRDPSHTTNLSTDFTGANQATGITGGGIDSMTLGSGCNQNGIAYTYWVLFADDTECNGGWGCNGEYPPVDPTPPAGGPWPPDPPDPGDEPDPTDPTDPDDPPVPIDRPCPYEDPDCNTPELTDECKAGTTAVVNRALSRIGHSKFIVDMAVDENTVEQAVALNIYGTAVNTTLRDFPWPFATRWNRMVVVGGTATVPVNAEWQYAYRAPGDCVFAKRIAATRGGALDPVPPPFELAMDTSGGLVYSNQAHAYLEYVARIPCAASSDDALFREALILKVAELMAVPLTRVKDIAKVCREEYDAVIAKAEAVIRPDKPGLAGTIVVDALATTKRLIVNRALVRIGAHTITQYQTDQSKEAQAARLLFDEEYRSVLQDFPWQFATAYATLVLADGAADDPVNEDWTFSYTLPTDFVAARRLVTGNKRAWEPNPTNFRIGPGVLFTEDETPVLEYTALVTLADADALFRDALAWRLAASLAPSLASRFAELPEQLGRGPEVDSHTDPRRPKAPAASLVEQRQRIAARAWQMYDVAIRTAKANNANQEQKPPDGDANWIAGR